jgi:uncharacterized protein with HEPN domain
MRDDRERLLDIQEAIARIEKYSVRGRQAFEAEELIQGWIVQHLQIIGEASRALSDGIRDRYAEVPWPQIIGMRNIVVHHYFDIDQEVVWSVVENDLPNLKIKVEAMLQELAKGS